MSAARVEPYESDLASIVEAGEPATEDDLVFACAWCGSYESPEDEARAEAGAPISHGICDACAEGVR